MVVYFVGDKDNRGVFCWIIFKSSLFVFNKNKGFYRNNKLALTAYFKINTVKPLLSVHPWDLPKCPLNRGCPPNKGFEIVKCLIANNIQRFLCTMIKFQVVNRAIPNSSSLPSVMLFVCMDCSSTLSST